MLKDCKTKEYHNKLQSYNGLNKEKEEDPKDVQTYLKRN